MGQVDLGERPTLEGWQKHGYVLSVTNDGPALPEEFDPKASEGLGMRVIQSFVGQ